MKIKILLVLCFLILVVPTQAQTVFTQGYYEFESQIANMTYTGTWDTEYIYGVTFRRGYNNAVVSFYARGKYVLIERQVGSLWNTTDKVRACVSSSCADYLTYYGLMQDEYFVVVLPDNLNNYQITLTVTSVGWSYTRFDNFMVLDEPSLMLPTPTAITFPTAYPSPTAITFPATATPFTFPTAAPDVAIYATLESGQMTKFEYAADAADVHISNLLIAIFVSVWGMFIIFIFVVWRVDKR